MRSWLWSSVVLAGCGPSVVPEDTASTGTGGAVASETVTTGGASEVSTTSTATGPTTLPPTTVTTTTPVGSGSSGSTSSSDSGGPSGTTGRESSTGEGECGPIEDFDALARLDNGGAPGASTWQCTIDSVDYGMQFHDIEMTCDGVSHTLRLTTPSAPAIPAGADVVLDTNFTGATFSTEALLKLTTADGRLIVAASASRVFPGSADVPVDFFSPLQTDLISDLCEVEPGKAGNFIGTCFDFQRESIRFGLGGDVVDVLDRNRAPVAVSYEAAVELAELRHDVICGATPERWYQWVVYEPVPK